MKKIFRAITSVFTLIIIRPIANLCFEPKYLKGKYFQHWYSRGWLWTFKAIFAQKIGGKNRKACWPIASTCTVISPENIIFDPDDLNNFQSYGNYFQAMGTIEIGSGTWIAPNVGLITANHDVYDLTKHVEPKPIRLGKRCWIGMNSVVLPGVELGDDTIVGAGSVVTKSFSQGKCVIAGNPAKVIKYL